MITCVGVAKKEKEGECEIMTDPQASAKKGECELSWRLTCVEELHKKPVTCVSRTLGYIYLCDRHDDTVAGHKETIRCHCFDQLHSYFSVYDPCTCQGKPHAGVLPLPTSRGSGPEHLIPPKKDRSVPDENAPSVGCDRCSKQMQTTNIFAKCTYCDDVYCSARCTTQMGKMCSTPNDDGVYEAICMICDDDFWDEED